MSGPTPIRTFASTLLVTVLVAACSVALPSVAPSTLGTPTPSNPGGLPGPSPSASLRSANEGIQLLPVAAAPPAHAVVTSVLATPDGFAVLGYDVGDSDPRRFVLGGSPDARTWNRLSAGPSGPDFTALAAGPLGWIAASDDVHGADVMTRLWFSADGVMWEPIADQAALSTSNSRRYQQHW